ncbi:LysR family transcriptional regulator [Novosphingobium fuchskuhlense]|uniref:LysR family transcriptional regulator n=1 Tax=Novosphingobium fuchskuhlense TaxID=1117702 RepID=A0A124JWQ9_9SPHN|nr:LysR family transcriptional regulator [Novosphingobium fuchskuhlense]KUR73593.1 LysR family transcriptional regulator [Novosphingobium fuchskuhlense]
MDRFEAMRTLLAAVDGGSLSAASRALNTPLPTVSRRVSDLEAHLGAQLLVRTSRKLILTEAGEAFVGSARRLLEDLADAERAASGEYRVPRGELLVTAPIMLGKLHVAPVVHAFLAAYPDVTVRLVLSDSTIDIVEAHVDVAIRIGQLPDSDLVARKLGDVRWIVCASPDYLARRGTLRAPADIAHHECIAFEGLHSTRTWGIGVGAAAQRVEIVPRLSVNTADAIIDAAVAGLGLARIMSYQAASAVADGRLVPLFAELGGDPVPVQLVHRRQRSQPLKLKAFLDFAAPRLRETLDGVAGCFG